MGMVNVIGQHSCFKLRILLAVIALALATKKCGVTSEAGLFQMPDILLKGTITRAFFNKKVYLDDINISAFCLFSFRQVCAI